MATDTKYRWWLKAHISSFSYGGFHPGRELTAIELENFWFAVKPISMWIYFKDFCTFVYVSIFLGKRSSSIWFTILLVELVSNGL